MGMHICSTHIEPSEGTTITAYWKQSAINARARAHPFPSEQNESTHARPPAASFLRRVISPSHLLASSSQPAWCSLYAVSGRGNGNCLTWNPAESARTAAAIVMAQGAHASLRENLRLTRAKLRGVFLTSRTYVCARRVVATEPVGRRERAPVRVARTFAIPRRFFLFRSVVGGGVIRGGGCAWFVSRGCRIEKLLLRSAWW